MALWLEKYVIAEDNVVCFDGGNLPPAVLDYAQGGPICDNLKKMIPKTGGNVENFEKLWQLAKLKINGEKVEIPNGNWDIQKLILLYYS